MGELQWSGNGMIMNNDCSKKEEIENYELAQVIANGIRQHFSELFYAEREYNNQLIDEKLKSDPILKQLKQLQNIQESYKKELKSLKWYQSANHLEGRIKNVFQEAKNLVGIENLTYHEAYYDYIGEIVSEVRSKIKEKLYLRDQYPNERTIVSILLLTPDFKNKSFKELIKVINNQTN